MPNYKLTYFDARSRGEPSRMLFHLVGQKYEDIRYDFEGEEWPKIKGDRKRFPLGQLPVLDVDGKLLTQSRAIYRYIARQFPGDYYGKNNVESSRIDEILGIVADIEIAITPAFESTDAAKREAEHVKCRDGTMKPSWDFISESLKKGEGKYFIGNRLTLADVVIFNIIDFFLDSSVGLKTYFEPYPTLVKFYESIKNDSPLTQYLKDRQYTKY
ncbi:glutathione S-transferase 1 [Strongylocentrotus purpuratus]|uniref:Glutathione transferase n=1 Tax=Strongylocentrotus purpuratus TaxID=7668 RepID=A0A7M7HJH8_STRPU|nr:glutathione S-transferase 1 [Strongylocentrotus purpuratus]|eukprot:XP_003728861.1 PREDICTED: glutathione S-transferase 1 isoform X5 [Strongylocentrotus purpuratus]